MSRPTFLRRLTPRAVTASLAVLTVALLAVGVVALVRAHDLRTSGPTANEALIDGSATSRVVAQVTTGLDQVLTYDYAKPQVNQAAAKRWLGGAAVGQYRTLFSQLQKKIGPTEKLSLVTKVHTAGVISLKGGSAQLLVFLDQQSTRASDGASSVAAAQVLIGATEHGRSWTIDQLRPI